jgi:hypothetical protein
MKTIWKSCQSSFVYFFHETEYISLKHSITFNIILNNYTTDIGFRWAVIDVFVTRAFIYYTTLAGL